jgi:heme-degrading protein
MPVANSFDHLAAGEQGRRHGNSKRGSRVNHHNRASRPSRSDRSPLECPRFSPLSTLGLIHLTNVIANQGALPIKVGDEVIGAAGASGAPGGEKDEACVKAGIDKVADQLK